MLGLRFYKLLNLNHFKVIFGRATFWALPSGWNIGPERAGCNVVLWPAEFFIVDEAAQ